MMIFFYFLLLFFNFNCIHGLKILAVFSLFGKSNSILGHALVNHLSEAEHEITYITPRPSKELEKNISIIDISSIRENYKSDEIVNLTGILDRPEETDNLIPLLTMLINLSQETIENPNVQSLLSDKNKTFDLVIVEWNFNEIYAGFSSVYKCPLIWFSALTPHWRILQLIGDIPNPAYNANIFSKSVPSFTFSERVSELWDIVYGQVIQEIYLSSLENETYNKVFAQFIRERGHTVPLLDEIRNNASLILSNSHVSTGLPESLPQNVIPIAGFHINPNVEPLPDTLRTLMDNAHHGVIYFSMGSNLQSKKIPTILKQNILKIFSKLKQTVIWKFEEDLPDTPKNVHLLKWVPQQSVLAHKNCVLFITHGGMLSTTEAIHFGVPIIAIPARGDQFLNVNRAVPKGFVIKVDLTYNLAEDLENAIQKMIHDPRYRAKAKELSLIYHDRPVPPARELIHWVEHVSRTAGAVYMRSPTLTMTWYQKYYVDLSLILLVILFCLKSLVKGEITNLTGILDRPNQIDSLVPLLQMLINLSQETVEHPNVQKLLADTSQNFDLVIIEWAFNEIFTGFSAVYNCPYIWFSTLTPHWMILQLVDDISNPAYSSNALSRNVPPFSFYERVMELWNLIWGRFVQRVYLFKTESETYEKLFAHHIRERNHKVPPLDELRFNASLVLSNSHLSTGLPEKLPQNVISIAGFHINANIEPLPDNLKKLMDDSPHGVIYFSMGSNLESKHFPDILKQNLLKTFSKFEQTVIWKFEENLRELPPNVHLLKWAPQNSILAHKNCILFISHGGLLSTTEAIHFGVPIIAIPARADQFLNVKRAIPKGFVIKVDYSYNLASDLEKALEEMLDDPRYKLRAKELSLIYHDRPAPPAKEMVHWVEHIAKTAGAVHMRSPALMMTWYQKYYVDLLLIIVVCAYTLKSGVKVIWSRSKKSIKKNQ